MDIKYAVITGFLGQLVDRFSKYQEARSIEEKFKLASQIRDLDGLEIVWPSDFTTAKEILPLLKDYNLGVSAVNLNIKAGWNTGSFTSPFKDIRIKALDTLKRAIDVAEEIGCSMVTMALLNDGHDYPFQLDYIKAWEYLEEGIIKASEYNPKIKISIEYKYNEPRVRTILGDVGKLLYFLKRINRENVGVTLDVGHAIYAGENPAESLSLLFREDKIFYIHINDNTRNWDWDMIPTTVNFLEYLEFMFYLKRFNYNGWIGIDVFPKGLDPADTFALTIRIMKDLENIVNKLDQEAILRLMEENKLVEIFNFIRENIR